MKKLCSFLFFVACQSFHIIAQETKFNLMPFDETKIELRLTDNEITVNSIGFDLKVLIINKSDSAFILYGFKDIGCAGAGEDYYRKANITVGSELFTANKSEQSILDIEGERQRFLRPGNIHTWKDVVTMVDNAKIIVRARSTETIIIPIKLHSRLERGIYQLQMLYYSGVNLVNIVDEETLIKDQKECGGLVYQGYAKSNSVKLIFK